MNGFRAVIDPNVVQGSTAYSQGLAGVSLIPQFNVSIKLVNLQSNVPISVDSLKSFTSTSLTVPAGFGLKMASLIHIDAPAKGFFLNKIRHLR